MDASLPQKYPWICWHLYKIRTCIETTNPGLVTNLVTHLLGVDRGMEAEASPWTQFYTFSESVRIFWPLFTSQNLGESFLCWPARVTFTSTDPRQAMRANHMYVHPHAHWDPQSTDEAAVVGNRAREYKSHVFLLFVFYIIVLLCISSDFF